MSYIKILKTQRPYGFKSVQIFHDSIVESAVQERLEHNRKPNQTSKYDQKASEYKMLEFYITGLSSLVLIFTMTIISFTEVVFCEVILTRLAFPNELLLAIKYVTCLSNKLESLLSTPLYLSFAILLLTCEIWNLVIHQNASRDWFLWANGNRQCQKPILRFFWAQVDFWSSVSVYGFNCNSTVYILCMEGTIPLVKS